MFKSTVSLFFRVCLLAGLATTGAHAADNGFVIYSALTGGGDTLATAVSDDGDHDYDLKAGGLIHFAVGYEHRFDGFGVRATYGYKFDTLDAENGDAEITRFPLEVGLYKRIARRHALGLGVVHELSPEFEIDINDRFGFSGTVSFEDATGAMIHYGYLLGDRFEFGLRYTSIDYTVENTSADFDADNIGIYFNTLFH